MEIKSTLTFPPLEMGLGKFPLTFLSLTPFYGAFKGGKLMESNWGKNRIFIPAPKNWCNPPTEFGIARRKGEL